MSLNISDLVTPMLNAVKNSLAHDWPKAEDYATAEMKRLAQSLIDIQELIVEGKVNEQQAKPLMNVYKNTAVMVFIAIEGLGIIAVENAINAALGVVRETVNAATGIAIL